MPVVPEPVANASSSLTKDRLVAAWNRAVEMLHDEQQNTGHWTGQLSTSALSTATAISAMSVMLESGSVSAEQSNIVEQSIGGGCQWLMAHQNSDGGFGDTDRSHSNIATTLLVLAAWELAAKADIAAEAVPSEFQRLAAKKYVDLQGSWNGLRKRYGKDKTFVVPILSNCALAGLVPWSEVSALPFEAAALPQEWYRWAKMPVVSYAIPALVAIGQSRFFKAPPRNLLLRKIRQRAVQPTLRVLRRMQPASGGYLEATPLTAFVLMNLAAVGHGDLPVANDCLRFILESRLADGSWPIDTNLATWATSLSIRGLSQRGTLPLHLSGRINILSPAMQSGLPCTQSPMDNSGVHLAEDELPVANHANNSDFDPASDDEAAAPDCHPISVSTQTVRWLLNCQHKQKHPFTGANPGGWGWTNLSGAVPDADDTPAALLALKAIGVDNHPQWQRLSSQIDEAGEQGVRWLLKLQNRDGGWPTFCKGWGTLPFDRSGTDLTAHAIRALQVWKDSLPRSMNARIQRAIGRGINYLERNQLADGSWLPLWFGNQDRPEEDNPCYGTGKVLLAYAALARVDSPAASRGLEYLHNHQNGDGSWGGGASVLKIRPDDNWLSKGTLEETAVALEGLLECGGQPMVDTTIMRGLNWLAEAISRDEIERAMPIGFYFAKLWYYERLYPCIFSVAALGSALRKLDVVATQ